MLRSWLIEGLLALALLGSGFAQSQVNTADLRGVVPMAQRGAGLPLEPWYACCQKNWSAN